MENFFFTGKRMTRKMCKILKDSRQDADQWNMMLCGSYFPSMTSVRLDVAIIPHGFVNHSLHTAEKNLLADI